jgi:hypothetical protein
MAKEASKGRAGDFAALKPDAQYDRLRSLYKEKFGKAPDLSASETKAEAGTGDDGLSKSKRRKVLASEQMRTELREKYMPSNAELEKLGENRAIAVRTAVLANKTIQPERIFLVKDESVAAAETHARMELKLE